MTGWILVISPLLLLFAYQLGRGLGLWSRGVVRLPQLATVGLRMVIALAGLSWAGTPVWGWTAVLVVAGGIGGAAWWRERNPPAREKIELHLND